MNVNYESDMIGRPRKDEATLFLDDWATDLAALVGDAWPTLRYVGGRLINDRPGLLLTAPRNEQARFDTPLNLFLDLSAEGLHTFFRDELTAYAYFNANLRGLGRYCAPYGVDLLGGSQSEPLTCTVCIDTLFAPARH